MIDKVDLFIRMLRDELESLDTSKYKLKNNQTQATEALYMKDILSIFKRIARKTKMRHSTSPKDLNIITPDGDEIDFEVKAKKDFMIHLNNTIPDEDTYYIIIFYGNTKIKGAIRVIHSTELITPDERKSMIALKKTLTAGAIGSNVRYYPRPTFMVNVRRFFV
jgi:hypothetical protein